MTPKEMLLQAMQVNVARFNGEDLNKLHELIVSAKSFRHHLFREAYDAFLRARGLIG
jgi:hypothetical protein